jgi:threonine dehydrogenase-like Zn-dependent dehydrogenase
MLAIAITIPNQVDVVDIPQPEPGPYEARIKTEIAALCNMTDRKLIEGYFPGLNTYPLLLGHETVGIVDKVGEKVRSFKVGDRVVGGLLLNTTDSNYASGWGGFCEYTLAGDYDAMKADGVEPAEVFEIMQVVPKDISIEDAVMLCTWREVYGAFTDFRLENGNNILIYGAGPVGLSFVKFARFLELGNIYVIDRHEHKRQKALELGATNAFSPDDSDLQDFLKIHQRNLDAVIDAVGTEEIINSALPLIKMGGSICVYGVIDTPTIKLEKHQGPFNFNLLIHQWPTRSLERAAQTPLVEWIRSGKLSYKEFVSAEFPIQDIKEALEYAHVERPIKILFRY